MREKILEILLHKNDLPPLPQVLLNLQKLINDPNSDNQVVAALVESDPVLSGRLIALANSAFHGGGREKVTDLPDTLMRLGIDLVLDLAYSLQLPTLFKRVAGFDQIRFWKHSFSVGLLSEFIAKKIRLPAQEQKVAYVAGLMHDLGILVLFDMIPEEYREFTQGVKDSEESLEVLEKEKFEITHSDVGYEFIRNNWKLDSMVAHSAEWHHRRVKDDKLPTNIRQAVSLANRIANSKEDLSHGITSFKDRPLSPTTIQMMDMGPDDYDLLLEDITLKVQEAESLLTS